MKLIRPISSIFLALLVLMASSSFYVGLHTCAGRVNAVAFLQEADGCGHQTHPPCHRQLMKGCCKNDQVVHESQDIKGEVITFTIPALSPTDIIHSTIILAEIVPADFPTPTSYFTDHPPALHGRDIIISIQTFLI